MSLEEIGLYAVCLNHCWINGSLPSDPAIIQKLLKLPRIQFERAWSSVSGCFQESDGRLTNPRQEHERSEVMAKSDKARASAEKRWCESDANALPTHCEGNARASGSGVVSEASEVIPGKKEKTSTRARGENDPRSEWFVEFWNLYWRKIAKKTAFTSYLQHVTTEDLRCAVRAAVIGQRPAMLSKEEHLRPHAATWINGHRWEDEIELPHVNGVRKSRIDTLFDELAAEREAAR